ncbi:MAG: DUF1453 family protein [Chloroflexi bacterium]|nr:DUF1453 family protein [Chloroflexota bacterium]
MKIADLSNPLIDAGGLLFIGILLLGQLRARRVSVRRLWLIPVLLVVLTGFVIVENPPQDLSGWGWLALAFVVGLIVGAVRVAFVDVRRVDPKRGVLLVQSTLIGIVLWLAIWAARIIIRQVVGRTEPDASTAALVTAILLTFAVGNILAHAYSTYRTYLSTQRSVAW